jgi:hypothetical protein
MTAEDRANLRVGIVGALRALAGDGVGPVRVEDNSGGRIGYDQTVIFRAVTLTVELAPGDYHPPADFALTPGQLLGLAALLEDESVTPNVLADYLLDAGHEYATAVAEKAAANERHRIAERLYGESAHALARPGDPDVNELVAAALSSVADDLTFGVPPTAPQSAPPE